jgi:CheY-like chemotaxis protein
VLTNLVSNAVKFTPQGEVRVTVQLSGSGDCRIDVADTGVGFSSSDRHRLFDRFEQADSSVMREYGGSGLGLAIVRELVDRMGGQLDCVSEPGVGSTFTVILPLPPTPAPATSGRPDQGLPQAARLRDGKAVAVLLADDHPINRRVVELILKDFNVSLTSVEDGAAALEAVRDRAGGFDMVLMDMQMPVMDGLTATRALRQFEAADGRARSPVIMVSANAMPLHLAESLEAGADLHLAKPLTAQSLIDALESVLQSYAATAGPEGDR